MSSDARLRNLVARWEEGHNQGCPLRPEEVCHDCPELVAGFLAELRRHIQGSQTLAPPTVPLAKSLPAVQPISNDATLPPPDTKPYTPPSATPSAVETAVPIDSAPPDTMDYPAEAPSASGTLLTHTHAL